MTDTIESVALACLNAVMKDEPWIAFGFTARPPFLLGNVNTFFQKLRSPWKRDLENTIAQQILATFTAAYVIAGHISSNDIPQVIEAYTKVGLTPLGYRSNDEGVKHLAKMIAQYHNTPIRNWSDLIAKQIDPMSIPDKKLRAAVMVGCIKYEHGMGGLFLALKQEPLPRT
jgi:hypothetical protein